MNEFQSTMWTLIDWARKGDEAALREFVQRYRSPIVAYCRRRGFDADAEDLAQEVLLRLLHEGVLLGADPSRGRLRSLILAVARNVIGSHVERLMAQKRGGGKVVPLGEQDVATPPDDDFDREWVAHLLEVALGRLEREHPAYHGALRLALLEGRSRAEVAAALGRSEGDVNNYLYRGKGKLIEYLREQIRDYSTSQGVYEEELAYLSRLLP